MVAESGLRESELPDCRPNGRPGVAADGRVLELKQWWGDRYAILVAIDETGSVVGRYLIDVDHTHLDQMRKATHDAP